MRTMSLVVALFLSGSNLLSAQVVEDNTFGGRVFTEVSHTFDNGIYVTQYFNYQFQRMECFYGRTSVGMKVLPWLKAGVNYVPVLNPGNEWKYYMELDVVGTLKSGNFNVSIRERYRHGFTGAATNELRSRLKVAYDIPDSKFGFYLAPEVYTWGDEWKKTRHYVGCTCDFSEHVQLEGYYIYYTFRNSPAEHVIGVGLNFKL